MRVSARRSEQILAVKASAMKTQGELIVALQKEVEKQRKQGAAEQLQLMEQLQQMQQVTPIRHSMTLYFGTPFSPHPHPNVQLWGTSQPSLSLLTSFSHVADIIPA